VFVVIGLSKFILLKILKVDFAEEKPVFGRIDLDFYIHEFTTSGDQEAEMQTEMRIFKNALDFTEVKVRECMIPRTEVVALSINEPIEKLRSLFIKTKLSKILIYQDTLENIIGFTHSFEIFKNPKDISSILLPISIVPEAMPASELLNTFTEQHKSIALVVDEFGQTSGMVTIEDVMEEIFGEIHDEHDTDEMIERQLGEKEYIFSGRLEIDYLNEKYGLNIPASDAYETLAGFIFHHHESVPSPKEEISIAPFVITILHVKDRRIEQVKLKVEQTE
jgi:putative hemolysin